QARKHRQQQVRQTSVESPNLEKPNNNQETFNHPIVTEQVQSSSITKQGHCFQSEYELFYTPAVSSDVAELKDMVRALILDKKNQTPAPAPVKAVEQSCVTCGGGHSYQNCPATDVNIYCDNIQEYVSQAAAVNYNQGNASYRPQMVANQIRLPLIYYI
ncbi:hypothetical protein Tco_0305630, partial [Tanacetum coccineum]